MPTRTAMGADLNRMAMRMAMAGRRKVSRPAGTAGRTRRRLPQEQADRTIILRVYRCGTCGRGHLRKLPPAVKMAYDFAGGNSMMVECVAYVMKRGSCKRCGGMITTATAPLIPGRRSGQGYWGSSRSTMRGGAPTRPSPISSRRSTGLPYHPTPSGCAEGHQRPAVRNLQGDPGPYGRGPIRAV